MALFIVSGSLDTRQPEHAQVYMSLTAGEFCCSSDLKDANLSAIAGSCGVVMLALPEKLWRTALYERDLDSQERIKKLSAMVSPSVPQGSQWLPANLRLQRFKGGSVIVRQGDPVESMMWVERGLCVSVVCFRGDKHVSHDTLPGCPSTGKLDAKTSRKRVNKIQREQRLALVQTSDSYVNALHEHLIPSSFMSHESIYATSYSSPSSRRPCNSHGGIT